MRVRFPLWIEGSSKPLEYSVRPLFHPDLFQERSVLLQRALARAQSKLRMHLEELKLKPRLQPLQELLYSPDLREHLLTLNVIHRKSTVRCRLFVITLEEGGRELGYLPNLGLWFERGTGSLEARLQDVVKHALKNAAKTGLDIEDALQAGTKVWVQHLEFELRPPGANKPEEPRSPFAFLFGGREMSGAAELRKVGRNLSQHREQAEVCLGRDQELEHLRTLFHCETRNSVVVVGPRAVGKSSLIRALVRAPLPIPEDPKKKPRKMGNYWLLSPGRLIAGMSIVGQWENRLMAILKHARKEDHVLVFDDLLGLLTAGISRDAKLSVAHVLKSHMDRGEIRVLAEMTPEAHQILRQRDRAFADLFQVVPLHPLDARSTLQVALATSRQVEEGQRCTIDMEALRAVLQISRRYLTNAANPGRVALPFHQLGSRYRLKEVGRPEVLDWFSQRSGLSLQLLDERIQLPRKDVQERLESLILGQPQALEACLDVVAIAKTRLREPGRPLGSLLFVGPTGVGKTECAKALAEVLFGSADRLLRFDMNEFVGEDSLARLVGSWAGSPGQLTQAIRQQPFAVVLLDEIEKAHPAVLQLLLQLLGDARLTDARGETSDFSQAIVILTSNLGASELQSAAGIRKRADNLEVTYRRAVQDFFTPELFNRLDRVVAFRTLERSAVAQLARRQLDKVLRRDGLSRRQCILQVSEAALERITDAGFHPHLGARALKRSVEQSVAAPVSAQLAGLPPDAPTLVRIDTRAEELAVEVQRLTVRPYGYRRIAPEQLLPELHRQCQEWSSHLDRVAPEGEVPLEDMTAEQLFYFEMRDGLRRLRAALEGYRAPLPKRPKHPNLWAFDAETVVKAALTPDLRTLLRDLRQTFPVEAELQAMARHLSLQCRAAWLRTRMRAGAASQIVWQPRGSKPTCTRLLKLFQQALAKLDFTIALKGGQLTVEGVGATELLRGEVGIHLFLDQDPLEVVQIGESTAIVRVYGKQVLDYRSGLVGGEDALLLMVLAGLEEPACP